MLERALQKYSVFYRNNRIVIPVGRYSYGPKPTLLGPPPVVKSLVQGSKIGSFCSVAPGLKFIFRGKHMVNWVSTYPFRDMWKINVPINDLPKNDPIIIGNDVWIASNVSIMQGVNVGHGSVIAQESFVTKNIPPYAIAGGHPANIIRFRFTDNQISELLDIAWWDWEYDKILRYLPFMLSENTDEFIRQAKLESSESSVRQ